MPKVGDKHFPYTPAGEEMAEDYAENIGQEVEYPTYDAGGRVQNIQGYGKGGKVKEGQKKELRETSPGGITSKEAEELLKGDSEKGERAIEDLRQYKAEKAQEKQRKVEPKSPRGRTKSKFKLSKKGLKDIKENPSMLLPSSPIKKKNKK